MAALVYHPAYDPYGSVLRSIRFLCFSEASVLPEQLRLFDFLLLFPEFISSFRLSPSLRSSLKKTEYRTRFRYEERPPAVRLFGEMRATFEAAFQTLQAKSMLELDDAEAENFRLNPKAIPRKLSELASERNSAEPGLLSFLTELNTSFPFVGPNGLKARSGLLEFRYDIV